MGFIRSKEEIENYYGFATRRFDGAQMLGIMYETEADVIAKLLPPPLEPAAEPWALSYISNFPDTNLGPGYRECALFIRCQYKGEVGNYCLSMPLDGDDDRIFNGREIYGFPKKTAKITLNRDGKVVEGSVERRGVRFATIKAELAVKMAEPPLKVGPSFLFKFMPRADLKPGFDGPILLVRQRTEIVYHSFEMGMGKITFEPSAHDSWSEIVCKRPVAAYFFTSDTIMHPGEVVGEADPDAFLPYSFARTDWGFEK